MTQAFDQNTRGSIDPTDLKQFERLGEAWWDERGPMGQLHKLNPTRIQYIRDLAVRHFGRTVGSNVAEHGGALAGLTILDIGCGGGVLAEPLARLGAQVTGIDPAPGNVTIARAHAEATGVSIDYRETTAEALVAERRRFDVVIASEVVEHVREPSRFIGTAADLVAPGGLFVASTLNRTGKAFLLAIVGAEYVLGWLPRGTHKWHQFVRPTEMGDWLAKAGLQPGRPTGMIYNPLRDRWDLGPDTDVNYIMGATRSA